ncbi:MAG: BREX-1 system adenine-specific DNA-methyltransferase PglX [Chloroflexota bacterium]|nr:BREX-1 system adenine-specific DNA-methyltransferase PglX [Chloroflexota bacterium]
MYIAYRAKRDPRSLRILDPACGSGHFLLYCFDLLQTVYEEAYTDDELGPALQADYPTLDDLRKALPGLVLRYNLHGIDIDLRATQIASLALWLRAQRAYGEFGIKSNERLKITRSNIVHAEPMPGERELLQEFVQELQPPVLGQLLHEIFDKMKLAGEAGSLLKIDAEIRNEIADARKQWQRQYHKAQDRYGNEMLFSRAEMDGLSRRIAEQGIVWNVSEITDEEFWQQAEGCVLDALHEFAKRAADGDDYRRTLFADDAARGFAFIDVSRKVFDVVLMNPPFGAASKDSVKYIERAYPRTKNDVYAAFVERGIEQLRRGGMLGAITSRTGFFLTSFQKWREEILLQEARPTVVADLGGDVLDTAMVETAAYCVEVVR